MEQVTIQDCGCIALPESVVTALDLRRGMALDVVLSDTPTDIHDAILLTPRPNIQVGPEPSSELLRAHCVILPPSR
jgi:hypothetical protein